jgi:hypothetical protein
MASIALSWHDAAGLFLVEGGRLVGANHFFFLTISWKD